MAMTAGPPGAGRVLERALVRRRGRGAWGGKGRGWFGCTWAKPKGKIEIETFKDLREFEFEIEV